MRKGLEIELKVGLFITLGVAAVLISLLVLGSTDSLMRKKNRYYAHFPSVEGLIPGAKVVMGGVQVGTVEDIDFDQAKRDVKVNLQIARTQADWVRSDSSLEIATQGVLGDKYLNLSRGSDDKPALPDGSEIENRSTGGLSQFISKGDQLMVTLQSIAGSMDRLLKNFEYNKRSEIFFQGMATTAKNLSIASERLNQEISEMHLKTVSKNLNSIVEKINNGTGTLGALVNDPGLYDDMKALMGGANRNRVVRNLVRQTIKKSDEAEAAAETAAPSTPGKKRK